MIPVEMLGHIEFPRIGELPYFLTLGPHAFYWFTLHREPEPSYLQVSPPIGAEAGAGLPTIALEGGWESLLKGKARRVLQTEVLPSFLNRQRWFAGKARKIRSVEIVDATKSGALAERTSLLTVEVRYEDGGAQTYALPICIALGPAGGDLGEQLAQLRDREAHQRRGRGRPPRRDRRRRLLPRAAEGRRRHRRELSTGAGRYRATPTSAMADIRGGPEADVRPIRGSAEQSNTNVKFGDRLIMKLFRRVEPGLNPELEIGRFLTEKTAFENFPKLAGAIEYRRPDTEPTAVAVFQELVSFQAVGWEHALDELGRITTS